MLKKLLVGVSRMLFGAGLLAALAAIALVYLSYRIVCFVTVGERAQPLRDAGFGVLVAAAGLGKALKAAAPTATVDE